MTFSYANDNNSKKDIFLGGYDMKNLFDIHCHILPQVDDGARNMDMALKMLKMEYDDGVRSIILTPHFRREMFETPQEKIEDQFCPSEGEGGTKIPGTAAVSWL